MLLWTYDIYLLLRGFEPGDAERFLARGLATGLLPAHAHPLLEAQARFPTPAGARIARELPPFDPAARIPAPRSPIRQLSSDLAALPGTRARLRLITGHLFPPADYMRATYAPTTSAPLPILYLTRIVRGARTWFHA